MSAYIVEVEYKNYKTGEALRWRLGRTFKTRGGAERAARKIDGVCRPANGEKLSETWGRVVEVGK